MDIYSGLIKRMKVDKFNKKIYISRFVIFCSGTNLHSSLTKYFILVLV
jgi:hypothetical protein